MPSSLRSLAIASALALTAVVAGAPSLAAQGAVRSASSSVALYATVLPSLRFERIDVGGVEASGSSVVARSRVDVRGNIAHRVAVTLAAPSARRAEVLDHRGRWVPLVHGASVVVAEQQQIGPASHTVQCRTVAGDAGANTPAEACWLAYELQSAAAQYPMRVTATPSMPGVAATHVTGSAFAAGT